MGIGRPITKEEAFEVLDRAEKAGFILQPENSQKPENICCGCGDCCGPLTAAKKAPRPADLYTSNYYVKVNPVLCAGCEVCIGRCQMEARKMINGVAIVDPDRCIGYGNCVVTCKSGASQLLRKEKQWVPFKDKDETFMKMVSRKLKAWDRLKLNAKMLLNESVIKGVDSCSLCPCF
jgi:electron transport complex protein RnfB